MAIACPYCDHRINLKSAKPGRYRPRCPKCDKPFALVIPDHGGDAYQVQAIRGGTQGLDDGSTTPNRLALSGNTPAPRPAVPEPVMAGPPADAPVCGLVKTNLDRRQVRTPSHQADPQPEPLSGRPVGGEEYAPPKADVRGYRIERELGRGGMGAVFLARQLSLDRHVALKVMSKRWATDPSFVARFTREAFAAAQLRHPNIVGIHDIGEIAGCRFFSMEYVPGRSLAELVRAEGKLDPETAVGYVLQAARGLKHAHDRGMIHRDVKPDNLLIDDQGLVKVADLGLVKVQAADGSRWAEDSGRTPDPFSLPAAELRAPPSGLTGARIALGTPAYMSPEQCRDAAAVDHRADIYSLGCTLYVLVTGRPPFDGTTAVELMTKHAYEPIVPPERIVARVPAEVSAVIQRMMAKGADDRFQNMGEVIRTLEAWLGVRHAGTFSPHEEQIGKLEGYTLAYNTAPAAVLRGRLVKGFFLLAAVLSVLLLFFGRTGWASGLVGLTAQATLAYFVIDGVARKGPLFTRVRHFVWGLGWSDWAIATAGVGLFALLLAMSGVFWIWVGVGAVGIGLAVGLRVWLDRQADDERHGPLDGCERLLRRLRMQGLDEEELRQFVAKFAGRHWEEFFEALFGYEAKLAARAILSRGGAAGPREKYAAWREPLLGAIERIEKARKEARERRVLAAVERSRLIAEGAALEEADRKANATAEAMIRAANQVRWAEGERVKIRPGATPAHPPPAGVGALMSGASNPDFAFGPAAKPDPLSQFVTLFVGPHIRAIGAALLLAGCGVWAYQNGLVPTAEVQTRAQAVVESNDLAELERAAALDTSRATKPLQVDGVAPPLTAWADSFNVGVAGLLLLGSLFFRGNTMSVLVLLGAGVAVAGHHLGIRPVEPLGAPHIGLLLGSVIALVGYRTGTR
ncbi:MAG: pknB 26 [Gemmataceae bacterium]|nr:pknB 26 [Gemmataceae bacterium]